MAVDAHKNLAISRVVTPPAPAASGTSLTLITGEGARMPAVPFNATVQPLGVIPTPMNSEIVRVTARTGDTITAMLRAQEGTIARAIVAGDLFFAGITAKALQDIETTYAKLDAPNTFTGDQTISKAYAMLKLVDPTRPVDGRIFRIYNGSGLLTFDAVNDAETIQQAQSLRLDRDGNALVAADIYSGRDVYEKGRSVPMGHLQDVPFNAANFWAATGSWIVEAGDHQVYAYTVVGKTCFIWLQLAGTTVTATTTYLYMQLPAGMTIARNISCGGLCFNDAATPWETTGFWSGAQSTTYLALLKSISGSPQWAVSTNATLLQGLFAVPIL